MKTIPIVNASAKPVRMARCGQCGHEVPSAKNLAFFVDHSAGTDAAEKHCKHCGYHQDAHKQEIRSKNKHICNNFEPKGDRGFDSYYCGCRGWD